MGRPIGFGPGFSKVQLLDLTAAGDICMSWCHGHRELGRHWGLTLEKLHFLERKKLEESH